MTLLVDVPFDILVLIGSSLPPIDLLRLRRINKYLERFVDNENLWRYLLLTHYPTTNGNTRQAYLQKAIENQVLSYTDLIHLNHIPIIADVLSQEIFRMIKPALHDDNFLFISWFLKTRHHYYAFMMKQCIIENHLFSRVFQLYMKDLHRNEIYIIDTLRFAAKFVHLDAVKEMYSSFSEKQRKEVLPIICEQTRCNFNEKKVEQLMWCLQKMEEHRIDIDYGDYLYDLASYGCSREIMTILEEHPNVKHLGASSIARYKTHHETARILDEHKSRRDLRFLTISLRITFVILVVVMTIHSII